MQSKPVGAVGDPAAPNPQERGHGMDKDSAIRQVQARIMAVFEKRPAAGRSTSAISARVENGLRCAVAEGDHTLIADMPEAMGGDEAGPTPGFYARAGLASCIAIGIKMTAVREGHMLDRVEVRVETDFDDAALFGLGDAVAGPLETRIVVWAVAGMSAAALDALVERALQADPWFRALHDAQSVRVSVEAG
jgi:uncharacterized OsmC-like protein